MLSIAKCFSILIASGHGIRCNLLKNALYNEVSFADFLTMEEKISILRKESKDNRFNRKIVQIITPLFCDVDNYYFLTDYKRKGK